MGKGGRAFNPGHLSGGSLSLSLLEFLDFTISRKVNLRSLPEWMYLLM